jgi:hypothetical protein
VSHSRQLPARVLLASALAALGSTLGCSSRPSFWNTAPTATSTVALRNGVAIVDDADHRVLLVGALGAAQGFALAPSQSIAIGHHVVSAQASPDGFHLFVLSTGDWPPQSTTDELPSLTVIDTTNWAPNSPPLTPALYPMTQPLPNLAIDPQGTSPSYAVAFQGSAAQNVLVENANELVIFDLTSPPADPTQTRPNPIVHTIQSFGGTPQALTFTPPLLVNPIDPAERLLVVETQIDVTLFSLDHAFDQPLRPEVTVPLTAGTSTSSLTPAGIAVDAFDPASAADARIAVRTTSDTNVFTIAFGPPDPGAANDFKPTVNLTDVGGVPSDMAFVHTDAGLRLAALVPTKSAAVLVEPDTSLTTNVMLPSSYSNLSLVTAQVAPAGNAVAPGVDVALLWNGSSQQSGVALWTLGNSVGQPYFSTQVLNIAQAVQRVDDVPNSNLKVLESNGNQFFVLNLATTTVFPLDTSGQVALSIAPDGSRIWAFAKDGEDLASIALADLNPTQLLTDAPIDAVFDVACLGDPASRALFALDLQGSVGATVFNAENPRDPQTPPRRVSGLLLEETP